MSKVSYKRPVLSSGSRPFSDAVTVYYSRSGEYLKIEIGDAPDGRYHISIGAYHGVDRVSALEILADPNLKNPEITQT